ncbi:hypothetical protein FRC07_003591 [Ceratobasidium sp. 392]|nr:hypothetical protein FRC07_003591 [Ceratobasidium sp. 392]
MWSLRQSICLFVVFFLFSFSLGNPNPGPSPALDVPAIAARAEPDSVDTVPALDNPFIKRGSSSGVVKSSVDHVAASNAAALATGTAGTTGRQINLAAASKAKIAVPPRLVNLLDFRLTLVAVMRL